MTLVLLGVMSLGLASCQSSHNPTCRSEAPPPHRAETNIDPGWPRANNAFRQVSYTEVRGTVPVLKGAEMVDDDELCMQCHETYVKSFHESNVHRVVKCESCHGPASLHVEARGKEPGLIFSFKKGVDPVARAEACLKCHEQDQCQPGAQWRTSKHAHCGVTCVDCHRGHYNVPFGTPATTAPKEASFTPGPQGQARFLQRGRGGQAEPAFAPRHLEPPGRDGPGPVLEVPLRHARPAPHRRPAPDRRTQRLQLHDVPRPARPDPRVDPQGPLLVLP